jgi:hypothetical protein
MPLENCNLFRKTETLMIELETRRSYDSALFVMVDASGHSSVVANNATDKASTAFNLLEKKILDRFFTSAQSHRCAYFERWGWQGDGGLFVLWDDQESIAIKAAIDFSVRMLSIDLPSLQKEFLAERIEGNLHLRVALHKGILNYTDDSSRGSIHSSAINHVAHLEKATPKDCVSLTQDVFRVLEQSERSRFHPVGMFEEHNIYVHSPVLKTHEIERNWYALHGLSGNRIQSSIQRPSEHSKSELLKTAKVDIVDIGSALRTCSGYLISTRRPAIYRDTVLNLLRQGVKYKCYLLNPDSESTEICEKRLGENLSEKIRSSVKDFKKFQEDNEEIAVNLELYFYDKDIGQAILGVDAHENDGLLLYSPIVPPILSCRLERADLPHYLVSRSNSFLYDFQMRYIRMVQEEAVKISLDSY